jgi:hypothetical protein
VNRITRARRVDDYGPQAPVAEDITMDADLDHYGTVARYTPGPGLSVGRIIVALIIAPPLLAFVAAGLWLLWMLADDAFGVSTADLVVLGLLTGTFAVSQLIAGVRRGSMVLVAAAAAPICLAFGIAGCALVFGG